MATDAAKQALARAEVEFEYGYREDALIAALLAVTWSGMDESEVTEVHQIMDKLSMRRKPKVPDFQYPATSEQETL